MNFIPTIQTLTEENKMIIKKYMQLCLARQYGGMDVMGIYRRWQ